MGTKICDEPLTVQLNFEPSNRQRVKETKISEDADDEFYVADR